MREGKWESGRGKEQGRRDREGKRGGRKREWEGQSHGRENGVGVRRGKEMECLHILHLNEGCTTDN